MGTIESIIDYRKLQFYGQLCRLSFQYLAKSICHHRLLRYINNDRQCLGLIPDIYRLIRKYNLQYILDCYIKEEVKIIWTTNMFRPDEQVRLEFFTNVFPNNSLFSSFFCKFIHSLIHSSFIHSFILSFIYSFICIVIHSFVYSCIRSFVRSFVRSFDRSFVRSFVHSFIHSFIHSAIFVCTFCIICCLLTLCSVCCICTLQ